MWLLLWMATLFPAIPKTEVSHISSRKTQAKHEKNIDAHLFPQRQSAQASGRKVGDVAVRRKGLIQSIVQRV
jgi:hypothetical protein